MLFPLKFKHSEENKVFFFSDFHHNHDKDFIYQKRGFSSIQEHNKILIERWNGKITDNDIVFHLGDLCFSKDAEQNMGILFGVLKFKNLYVMCGNHYSGYKQWFERVLNNLGYNNGIDKFYRLGHCVGDSNKTVFFIPNYYEVFVNNRPFVLCHYPVKVHNGYAQGSMMLFGHCHGSFIDGLPTTLDRGKMLDVGPESVKEPLSFSEIMEIMDKKQIIHESHHSEKTQNPFC